MADEREQRVIESVRAATGCTEAQVVGVLNADWDNADDHAAWRATAPVPEIVSWAAGIVRDVMADEADCEEMEAP